MMQASVTPMVSDTQLQHFHVRLDHRPLYVDNEVLLPGYLLHSWADSMPNCIQRTGQKVLVRLNFADWVVTAKHSESIRILQSRVLEGDTCPILDATLPTTTVAGQTVLNQGEQLQVAEIFAGSFMGWTQAAYVIHRGGHPVRTRLLVDNEASCCEAAAFTHLPLRPVSSPMELCRALRGDCNMFIVGEISDPWCH